MTSGISIRPAQPADSKAIIFLIKEILGKEYPQDQVAYPTEDLANLDQTYGGPKRTFLVAEEAGQIVGTLGVMAEDGKTAILRRLFVDPKCRGKGVGSGLMEEALRFCRSHQFETVMIRTSTRMEQAIRLCISSGFQEDGRWTLGEVTLVRLCLGLK